MLEFAFAISEPKFPWVKPLATVLMTLAILDELESVEITGTIEQAVTLSAP